MGLPCRLVSRIFNLIQISTSSHSDFLCLCGSGKRARKKNEGEEEHEQALNKSKRVGFDRKICMDFKRWEVRSVFLLGCPGTVHMRISWGDSQATYIWLGKLSTIYLELLGTESKDSMETSILSLAFGNHLLAACCLSSAGVCIWEQSEVCQENGWASAGSNWCYGTEAGSRAVSKCYSMTGIWEDNIGRLSKTNPVTQVRVGGICRTLFKLLSKAI